MISENSFSHVDLDPLTDLDFWKYSWAEMGLYDLPTMFKYIKAITGADKVGFIALSMGTTAGYYWMSKDYEAFKKHVSVFIALAPITRISASTSPLVTWLAERTLIFQYFFE